jgi:hypothetical protein
MGHEIKQITKAEDQCIKVRCQCGLQRQASGYPSLTRGLHIATQQAGTVLEAIRRFDGHLEGAEDAPAAELAETAGRLGRGAAELREQAAMLLRRAEALDAAVVELQSLTSP